jgi:hypothetical protein
MRERGEVINVYVNFLGNKPHANSGKTPNRRN